MLSYTDGGSFTGSGTLDTGFNDRSVCRNSDFIAFLKACSAVFIAGFASDKLFMKVLTGVTWAIISGLVVLAIYVFFAPIKKYVLLHITA
jgi:hypothetical protein